MQHSHLALALLVGATAAPAFAQTAVAPSNVTAGDVATTPLSDLNLKKEEIPPILLAAREATYDLGGGATD